ncbi:MULTISPECIES: sterol desaturase family protein [unclassified Mucilaginibacter]|uniref:sterol desaturase family protein n=1 Tax=unclassified Mucilaginibacter TaxID=2617802 RepID=UPI002AC8B8FC|nr:MULTISPECIES: sterol desaturase family protein [unclassified Mucilaginibacter]MEB0260134.1 sterol desaturase family protein [Mucilaginibacter sp. 10I4]MEB0279145.1 sterol desaturase family protein [Mucilaginibacter sp. 10B2]MEB0301598.1 sterol desaturase family protein [Mucilaginibacter sp. 5C4]WPX22323.1 sterol desaturase family protein [Mucilaginibacter sp. 5C4]
MAKNFVSNSQESVRMFKSSFLESLSKVHYFVPVIIFLPVILVTSYLAYDRNIGVVNYIWLFIGGLFVWTLTEYIMHRFVFHFVPKQPWALRLHFIFHGVHHDYPSDAKRLVMPPSASIPLATGFYLLFNAFLPANYILGFFPGFILGYLFYDISHYAIHHFNFKGNFWKRIKQHHMLHHYQDPTKGYGVSSPLWDKIFSSDFIKKQNG